MEILVEILVAFVQLIAELIIEITLMIFHFGVKKFPRFSIAFFLAVAGLLFLKGYLIAGAVFVVVACIILGLYVYTSKK